MEGGERFGEPPALLLREAEVVPGVVVVGAAMTTRRSQGGASSARRGRRRRRLGRRRARIVAGRARARDRQISRLLPQRRAQQACARATATRDPGRRLDDGRRRRVLGARRRRRSARPRRRGGFSRQGSRPAADVDRRGAIPGVGAGCAPRPRTGSRRARGGSAARTASISPGTRGWCSRRGAPCCCSPLSQPPLTSVQPTSGVERSSAWTAGPRRHAGGAAVGAVDGQKSSAMAWRTRLGPIVARIDRVKPDRARPALDPPIALGQRRLRSDRGARRPAPQRLAVRHEPPASGLMRPLSLVEPPPKKMRVGRSAGVAREQGYLRRRCA